MANISRVEVGRSGSIGEWCLSWDFKGDHYHVWLNDDYSPRPGVGTNGRELYKRSDGVKEVRYLYINPPGRAQNKEMFDAALALAKDSRLFEKAQEKVESAEKERLAKAQAEYLVTLAEKAGPEMLKVLQQVVADLNSPDYGDGISLVTMQEVQRVIKLATEGEGVPL